MKILKNLQHILPFFQIKYVNIRPEDIIEGNSKLTLGLIWTIILNFQVSVIKQRQKEHEAAIRIVTNGNGSSSHQVSRFAYYYPLPLRVSSHRFLSTTSSLLLFPALFLNFSKSVLFS